MISLAAVAASTTIQLIADETKKAGFARSAPKVDDLIWSGASNAGS